MMNLLNKETLIDATALGGGVVASKLAKKFLGDPLTKALPESIAKNADTTNVLKNIIPIVGGVVTLMVGGGNRIATGVANGMFADAFAGIVDFGLLKAGAYKTPLMSGTDDVFMGEVLMGEAPDASDVLMGAAEDMPNYSADSYDFTSADAGELNY